ncbi:MAG: TetR family transcriptional regulator [Actinobacteria bacterium]|nr:MAG: TetR family transcriptional regulator [Actinomycetota bacterium]
MMESSVSLRESNKARTRLAISDVATRLFITRGFETVTVAEIAEAAHVSVKTVFNYFSTKEDLFFDRADDVRDAIVGAIRERPEGTSVLGALHELLTQRRVPFDATGWRPLRDPQRYEDFRSFIAAERASPALRARRLAIAESWTHWFEELLAEEMDERQAKLLAALIVGLVTLRDRELSDAMLAGASARTVERRVRALMDEGFARLSQAFPR